MQRSFPGWEKILFLIIYYQYMVSYFYLPQLIVDIWKAKSIYCLYFSYSCLVLNRYSIKVGFILLCSGDISNVCMMRNIWNTVKQKRASASKTAIHYLQPTLIPAFLSLLTYAIFPQEFLKYLFVIAKIFILHGHVHLYVCLLPFSLSQECPSTNSSWTWHTDCCVCI